MMSRVPTAEDRRIRKVLIPMPSLGIILVFLLLNNSFILNLYLKIKM